MDKQIKLLECTLRDGSYTVDFSFTSQQTYNIVKKLSELGFEYIEVGHGVGLGASKPKIGIATETDEEYIKVAKEAAPNAEIASFFIPTVGSLSDIKKAKDAGLDVLRIGTNISEYYLGEEALKLAKSLGLEVSWNLMKSYAVPPNEFKRTAKKVTNLGADTVVLVDSAGTMLPEEVNEYLSNLTEYVANSKIGFHGHNNLGLSVSNVLEAIKCGATIIDTSIGGMGRSAGNAQTEIIVHLLQKKGLLEDINIYKLMDFAKNEIFPLMNYVQGNKPQDVACGMGSFHSSFMPIVQEVAKEYDIQLEKLIIAVGKDSPVRVTQELVEQIAKVIKENN
ncbi:4-hydroxy-2-oxovalerate aldolase [Halanaerocella petrolearia]